MNKTVIYDCEIARCIPTGSDRAPNLKYCRGWKDFEGMGIAVICAYSSWDDRSHVYLQDNLPDFQTLVDQAEKVVGFNSVSFDDKLCAANGLTVKTTYDLLCQVRVAAGMPPYFVSGVTRAGYSLEKMAKANLGYGKSGSGALAPELWQRGERGKVIDYCLGDVDITRKLYEKSSGLIDPTNENVLTLVSRKFTQEEGQTFAQHNSMYSQYLRRLIETYSVKAGFIYYLDRYYRLKWEEYWQKDKEDRWRMAYRILDRLNDFPGGELPEEVQQDLNDSPP